MILLHAEPKRLIELLKRCKLPRNKTPPYVSGGLKEVEKEPPTRVELVTYALRVRRSAN